MSSSQMPLQHLCQQALAGDPERRAIEFAGRWTTWGQLQAVAQALQRHVAAAGVPPGAPAVLLPRNRPSSVAAFLGLLAAGRSVRMVYAFQAPAAVARELQSLNPAVVVADAEDHSPELDEMLKACGSAAIFLGKRGVVAFRACSPARVDLAMDASEPAQIEILTSGTTGAPRRFGIGHAMVAEHLVGANKNFQAPGDPGPAHPPLFLYYPLGNISGVYTILPALLRGLRISLVERFSVEAWRDHLRRHRPERASLPPAGFQMVLDAAVPPEDLAFVRSIATGAAPLPVATQRAFEARYKVLVVQSYGATEFGGPVTSMTPELRQQWGDSKLASVGRPIGGARLRVVDPDTGAELPPGQEGVLEVATPRMGPDFIRTSDLAVIDADGFLFHRGRADGAIVRGGFKLLPATIEQALQRHAAVAEAAVVGLPDARLGQVPAVAVQTRPGTPRPSPADLERHLRDHVYATHIPVAFRIVDELPRNASFKVDRAAVAGLFLQSDSSSELRRPTATVEPTTEEVSRACLPPS